MWYGWPAVRELTDQAFPCVFDALATGCVLAIARTSLERSPAYRRVLDARWFWAIPAVCIGSLAVTTPWLGLGVAMSVTNLAIALAIHRCVSRPDSRVGVALERPVLIRIGTLSYSLYLWQQLFLDRHATTWIHRFPLNLVFAAIAAVLSYRLIETPFLRLSARLRARPAATSDARGEIAAVSPVSPAAETLSSSLI
jgi:peptidoglycan/LPS O-acetylase OafA/YrhL